MTLRLHIIAGLAVALGAPAAMAQLTPDPLAPAQPVRDELPEGDHAVVQDSQPLFFHVDVPAEARPLAQSVSHVAAIPHIELLRRSDIGTKIVLNVEKGVDLRMTVTRIEHRPDGTFSVRGMLNGLVGSSVMIAVQDDALAADITAPTIELHYKTRYVKDGTHIICKIDDMKYATCAPTPAETPNTTIDNDVPEQWELDGITPDQINSYAPRGTCSPTVVFDSIIAYTDVARAAAGGTSAIQAECQLAIDRTNESYENSPIGARIRLVRRYEITYNETGTYEDHLDRLTGTNGMGGAAPWTTARTNRDTYNADFFSLWVDDSAYCGLAWCTSGASRGYSVVTWHCAAGNLSHPHELGHNQGCGHDVANGGCGYSAYAYGWRFTGNSGTQYRTVMAYAPGTRIPYFSNPSQTFDGVATGSSGVADNEQVMEERKATCEAFEATRWDIFIDSAYGGIEAGTNALPYNTFNEGVTNIDDYVTGASEYPNLYLKSDFTTFTGDITKPMTITTCGVAHDIGN